MKNILVHTILIMSFLLGCSKSGFYSDKLQKAAKLTNKAEMAITNNQLDLAKNYYAELFDFIPNPSGRDVWNLAMVAKNTGNKTVQDSMVKRLFYKGYKVEKIAHCFDTAILTPLITEEYLRIKKEHEEFEEKIFHDDQQVNNTRALYPERWINTSLKNIIKIKRYVNKVDSLNIPYFSLESYPHIGVVFLHFYQMWNLSQLTKKKKFIQKVPWMKGLANINYESFEVTEFLNKQIEKGNYSKEDLAYFLEFSFNPFPYYAILQINDKTLILNDSAFSPKNLQIINQNRKNLLCCSHSEFMKQARFMDSIKYDGKIFKTLDEDDNTYFDLCTYDLASSYRFMMSMADPSEAEKQIEKRKKRYKEDSAIKLFNPLMPIQ